ncbi:MAG: hypothetical protein IPM21_18175 [Acidobacteria bacterium]|nr:hypothetical protein [Acidobacteriota bacterium]
MTIPTGLGLRSATLTLTDPQGVRRTAATSSFVFYNFGNVVMGQSYTNCVSSRRYRLVSLILTIIGNLNNVDFVGLD